MLKSCCKNPSNWKHDGARGKRVVDRGAMVTITQQNYLTCAVCSRKLSMFVNKSVVEAHRREKVTHERA